MPSEERSASLGAKYLEIEQNFKRSVRKWSKPSPAFSSHTPRLAATKGPYTQAAYSPKEQTILSDVQKAKRVPSFAFGSKSLQRPPVKPLPTDVIYDPRPQTRPRTAAAAFRSTTPRMPAGRPLLPGQEALAEAKQPRDRLHKGAVGLLSKQPRLAATPEPVCDAVYQVPGTMDLAARKRPKSSTWALSTSQQRPSVTAPTDLMYTVKNPVELAVAVTKHSTARAAFASTTPRMTEPKSVTPPPGAYASKFISCGMIP